MNAILVAVVGYTNNLSAILLSIAAILLSASRVKSSARNLRKITRKIVAARILSRKMLARVKRPAISCARKLRKNLARGRPALILIRWYFALVVLSKFMHQMFGFLTSSPGEK